MFEKLVKGNPFFSTARSHQSLLYFTKNHIIYIGFYVWLVCLFCLYHKLIGTYLNKLGLRENNGFLRRWTKLKLTMQEAYLFIYKMFYFPLLLCKAKWYNWLMVLCGSIFICHLGHSYLCTCYIYHRWEPWECIEKLLSN